MIEVSGVSFAYQGKTVLHDVSFSVKENSVVALVGPNGAGKTTLMRCLAGLHTPLSGDIRMNEFDVLENPRAVHQCTGYLSDFFGLYDNLTVKQCLLNMAWSQKLPKEHIQRRITEVAEQTELTDFLDKKAGTLSRGYRQRLGVALAIIHKPKILLLDEPASGMDPEARIKLSELMQTLKNEGMTIIVSSHILAELEDYCTDMLVLRDGVVRDHVTHAADKPEDLIGVSLRCIEARAEDVDFLSAQDHVSDVKRKDNEISFAFAASEQNLSELLRDIVQSGTSVFSFEAQQKSLQKAYMDLAETSKTPAQSDKEQTS